MVPPPAPMVLIISMGTASSQSPMRPVVVSSTRPCWPRAMSVLVPPISSETAFSNPAVRAISIPAMAPAHGPDSTVVTGVTEPMRATPPLLCIT